MMVLVVNGMLPATDLLHLGLRLMVSMCFIASKSVAAEPAVLRPLIRSVKNLFTASI